MFLPLSNINKPGVLVDFDGCDLLKKHISDSRLRHKAIEERKKHFPFSCRDSSYLVDLAIAKERQNGGTVFWKDSSLTNVPKILLKEFVKGGVSFFFFMKKLRSHYMGALVTKLLLFWLFENKRHLKSHCLLFLHYFLSFPCYLYAVSLLFVSWLVVH